MVYADGVIQCRGKHRLSRRAGMTSLSKYEKESDVSQGSWLRQKHRWFDYSDKRKSKVLEPGPRSVVTVWRELKESSLLITSVFSTGKAKVKIEEEV